MIIILFLWFSILSGAAWANDCNTCWKDPSSHFGTCTLLNCLPPALREVPVGDSNGNVFMICNADLTSCRGEVIEQNACYQRMQAAIRMVEQARDHEGKNITYIIEGVEYTRWSLTEPQRHLWLDVVEQCVEKP